MIRFRGVYPAYDDSIIVTSLKNEIMPRITYTAVKVPHRPGMLGVDKTHDARTITVTFELNGKSAQKNAALAHQLAVWAESDEAGQIMLDDQPERIYMGLLSNATEADYAEPWPEVTLTFTCDNPYGFASEPTQANVGSLVLYEGDIDVWPVITFVSTQDLTSAQWYDGTHIIRLDDPGYTIRAGHTIVIDNANRFVTDNGESIMHYLTLASDWMYLKRGANTITGPGGIVKWRDIYL